MATVTGTSGDDSGAKTLNGTNLADQIFGLAGNDTLIGYGGDDLLEGGAGADELFGTTGFDTASYKGSPTGVSVYLDNFIANGGHGTGDALYSIDGLVGSAYADTLVGTSGRNVLRGEGGADGLVGAEGNDRLEGGGGNDYLEGGFGDDELRGGDGVDTASFFNSGSGVVADLAAGTASGGAFVGSDRLSGVENLFGTALADRLAGNEAANVLTGSYGADVLTGRGGADRFVFNSKDDSDPKAPDRITDFSRAQRDRIDLREIDANEQVDGNQAFQFIGQAPFSGVGQVRFYQQNGDTVIEAKTTDAFGAEPVIVLDPLVSLQDTDFLL
jgi:Ca2+-binding RTX toxin-like protein